MTDTRELNQILGDWRITATEIWGTDMLDLAAPARLSLREDGCGVLTLVAIWGDVDYRVVARDGLPGIEFSWQGDDAGHISSGRGWATIDGSGMEGRIFIHKADDSSFTATRDG